MDTIGLGSRGQAVERLQTILGVPVDGVFGAITDRAVREFQQIQGLVTDGVVGTRTWERLIAVESAGRPDKPVADSPTLTEWWARVAVALAAETGSRLGYYPFGISDARLRLRAPDQRWVVCSVSDPAPEYETDLTTGTCGHHCQWLIGGVVGDADQLPAATGMNLGRSWNLRSPKWQSITPRSSCSVALLQGNQTVANQEGDATRYYPCRGYADLFSHLPGGKMGNAGSVLVDPGIYVVELASHVVVALRVPEGVTLADPRNPGRVLAPGLYRWAADGSRMCRGKPHTLRPWGNEPGSYLHAWYLAPGQQVAGALNWGVSYA